MPMADPSTAAPRDTPAGLARLDRLEAFLREDPSNPLLLADAFDVALGAGALDRAAFHLRHGLALAAQGLHDAAGAGLAAWRGREAHWLMASGRWAEARSALEALLETAAPAAPPTRDENDAAAREASRLALAHDLAYADLRLGDAAAGVARLAPWLADAASSAAFPPAVEATWLRLLHHTGAQAEALAWLAAREAAGLLAPSVAGVGSLIALDHADLALALRWAEAALAAGPPPEALVTRATLALGERDPRLARRLLDAALAHNPGDGRTWSALGYTELLESNLAAARQAFDRAIASMPGHVGTWHGLGWASFASGDLDAARAAFEQALALDRNFAESHGALAAVAAQAGDAPAARTHAERALRLDRQCLSARYAQALLAGELRDQAAVVRLAERLLGTRR